MKCIRGRVAITLPFEPSPQNPAIAGLGQTCMFRQPRPRIHIGHARTMLLGEVHCQRLGLPYHLRIDADWPIIAIRDPGWEDLLGCVSWFGIRAQRVYRQRAVLRSDAWYAERIGAEAWGRLTREREKYAAVDKDHFGMMADDLEHYPSLMIRGMEFEAPQEYLPDWPPESSGSWADLVAVEKAYYRAARLERNQLAVPLVTDATGAKMGKSLLGLGWDALQAVSADEAKAYLFATVVSPRDPLSAIGEPVPETLDPTPHVWSWETWGSYVRSL